MIVCRSETVITFQTTAENVSMANIAQTRVADEARPITKKVAVHTVMAMARDRPGPRALLTAEAAKLPMMPPTAPAEARSPKPVASSCSTSWANKTMVAVVAPPAALSKPRTIASVRNRR